MKKHGTRLRLRKETVRNLTRAQSEAELALVRGAVPAQTITACDGQCNTVWNTSANCPATRGC